MVTKKGIKENDYNIMPIVRIFIVFLLPTQPKIALNKSMNESFILQFKNPGKTIQCIAEHSVILVKTT